MPRVFWQYQPPRNQRLDRRLYAIAGQSCFVTIRAARGPAPFVDDTFARIAVDCLLGQRVKSHCQVDVYCVMPDHVHAIVTPMRDGASSLTWTDHYKGWCSRVMRQAGWMGDLWQRGSYDHLLRAEDDMAAIGRYILGNPLRKGLCSDPDDYPWSGIPERLDPVDDIGL